MLAGQFGWRHVAPSRPERDPKTSDPGLAKAHRGGPAKAPGALDPNEHARLRRDHRLLLLGSQLQHSPRLVGIAESREDLAADAEVGMSHVPDLGSLRHAERQPSKVVRGHVAPSRET